MQPLCWVQNLSFFHLKSSASAFRDFSCCRVQNICQICLNSGSLGSHTKKKSHLSTPSIWFFCKSVLFYSTGSVGWRKRLSAVSQTAVAQKTVLQSRAGKQRWMPKVTLLVGRPPLERRWGDLFLRPKDGLPKDKQELVRCVGLLQQTRQTKKL